MPAAKWSNIDFNVNGLTVNNCVGRTVVLNATDNFSEALKIGEYTDRCFQHDAVTGGSWTVWLSCKQNPDPTVNADWFKAVYAKNGSDIDLISSAGGGQMLDNGFWLRVVANGSPSGNINFYLNAKKVN